AGAPATSCWSARSTSSGSSAPASGSVRCSVRDRKEDDMGDARKTAERFYELFEAGDLDGAEALFASSCVTITPMGTLNNNEHRAFGQSFLDGLPDAHMEVVRVGESASGNEAFGSGHFKGTRKRDLVFPQATLPASGS